MCLAVTYRYQQNYQFPMRYLVVLVNSFTFCHVPALLLLVNEFEKQTRVMKYLAESKSMQQGNKLE